MAKAKHEHATPTELPDHDSDGWVEIYPEPALAGSTARALLDKATELGFDERHAVVSVSGGFRVPQFILDATDLPTEPLPARGTAPTPLQAIEHGAVPDPDPSNETGSADASE